VEPSDYAAARRYLAPWADSPWRWDGEGQVVEWSDGTTVAFRPELEAILRRLAPRGLPPMNALVLLLAACRETWPEMAGRFVANLGYMASVERSNVPAWLSDVLRQLGAVHALPAELRNAPEAKALLAEMVFENWPNPLPAMAATMVVGGLATSTDAGMLAARDRRPRTLGDLMDELRPLRDGLAKVDADALRLRRQTGLDTLVRPAEVDLQPADRVRRLIAELRNDDALCGVARMAGQLLAAMNLPRPIADRDDLPVGGVSDISNRGSLDRLLTSELAQDDLTLAVRVAMGEALYLRREAPPRNPPRHRAVLIDVGIRLWGIPRVFATAVALAIAATADRHITVDVYRAKGPQVVPVDLTRREGLVEQMAALALDPHPGDALMPFVEAVSAQGPVADLVLITGEDVAADADFRRMLAALAVPSLFLATVSRDGRFRLVARSAKSHQAVSEARLKLDELLAPRGRPATSLVDERQSTDLPAILAMRPFPLLLSYQPNDPHRHWVVDDKGVLGISRQRCLMHWQDRRRGARLLAENMPDGPVHWATSSGRASLAVVGQFQQLNLWLVKVDLKAGACQTLPLEVGPKCPVGVCGHGGMIFVLYPDRADMFETEGGCRIQSLKIHPSLQWRRDRFFIGRGDWHALSYDGIEARLERLIIFRDPLQRYLTFMDVEGQDGPIGLTCEGMLYDSSQKRTIKVAHGLGGQVTLRAVARNGRHVIVSSAKDTAELVVIEVPSGQSRRVWGDPRRLAEPEFQAIRPKSLRQQLQGALVDDAGRLSLLSSKGRRLQISLDPKTRQITLADVWGRDSNAPQLRRFQRLSGSPLLKVAAWEDGSRVFLDARGMLHLKSSDPVIPELTLILKDDAMAGWCADGRLWGESYFTDSPNCRPETIYTDILKPFLARLR
jgi:hypothetical protein